MIEKKFGTIQIDVDELWIHYKYFKNIDNKSISNVYNGLPCLLDLLDEFNFKITFFIVGDDLKYKNKADIVKEIHRRGHEIANHSMSHPIGIEGNKLINQSREIIESEKILSDLIGEKILGYRSPGYSIGPKILDILQELNYLYDSSILPSLTIPIQKIMFFLLCHNKNRHIYGPISSILSKMKIYTPHQKHIWKQGNRGIFEVPVSTIPFVKFPFHMAFAIAYGTFIFDIGFNIINKTNYLFNYLLHGLELADNIPNNLLPKIYKTNLPLEYRKKIYRDIFEKINKYYNIITTKDLIRKK